MTTIAQKAAQARSTLKLAGIKPAQVSLTSAGGSINARIKDPSVPFRLVHDAVKALESVARCEMTGEILCGGNTYVFVDYTDDAIDTAIATSTDGKYNGYEITRPADAHPVHPLFGRNETTGKWFNACNLHHAVRNALRDGL